MASLPTTQYHAILKSARTIVIAFPSNPSIDSLAAGLAIYSSFSASQTSYLHAPQIPEPGNLPHQDKISTNIPNQKLIISFPVGTNIEQITTEQDQEHGHFNIMVHPQLGSDPFDAQKLSYTYTLPPVDLIIGIENVFANLQSNPQLQQLLSQKPKIIHLSQSNPYHQATLNIQDQSITSLSQLTYQLFIQGNTNMNPTIATTLLAGIEDSTQSFSLPDLTPETFETVAQLLRQGGLRPGQQPPQPPEPPSVITSTTSQAFTDETSPLPAPATIPQWLNPPRLQSRD